MPAVFLDGPAAGKQINLRTCPHFLRVVRHALTGTIDTLDQHEDVVSEGEEIFIYVMNSETWGQVFVRPGGYYEYGEYSYLSSVDETDRFKDRDAWVAWVKAHGNSAATLVGLDPWRHEGL